MKNYNIQREEIEKVYGKISPFEFKNKLIDLATFEGEKAAHSLLDAGRGNPNWIATTPREAFFTFGLFAILESRRVWNAGDLAGMPRKDGIYDRFNEFIKNNQNLPGIDLLKNIIEYGIKKLNFTPDNWVHELTDGIIGDNYPLPDRMLTHLEKVVSQYLIQEMKYNKDLGDLNIYAVEGATAAMCYIFDSLIANELLIKRDKIAIMTPIFTPYLEIPLLPRYDFKPIFISANETTPDGTHTWQYPDSELEKLRDKDIKALFVVNPSNPASVAISPKCTKRLVDIIKTHNPNLMIISDDVYGTFVDGFRSLMADLPFNTLGVYSYSKYFGVTGWRLGTLCLHDNNVFDKLLKELDDHTKKTLDRRYGDLSDEPEKIPFIDRIVADSRQVALNHTAGLSTPQQVQMGFFSIFALIDKENKYKNMTINICHTRKKLLFDSLGLDFISDPNDAAYYTEFDLLEWANIHHGEKFASFLEKNYKPVDLLFRLAQESSIVLLSGSGFSAPEWSIRISLANLPDDAYTKIGTALKKILDDYVNKWNESY